MKSSTQINNIKDLKAEIARLQLRKKEQEAFLGNQYGLLKDRVSTPFRVMQRVTSHVPGAGMLKGLTSGVGKAFQQKDADWLTRILQFGAPIVLNSTLLRKAGWAKKALVLLASETAIGQVNKEKVGGLIDKLTDFMKPKKRRKKSEAEVTVKDEFVQPVAVAQPPLADDEPYIGL